MEFGVRGTVNLSNLAVRTHLWYAGHGPERLAFLFARLHPRVRSLEATGECWCVETTDRSFYLSDPRQITRVVGLSARMQGRVLRKYIAPEFVEVESGDTVVDIGAFIGEFARSAGEIGTQVIAVEPDDRNAGALRRNLEHISNSVVIQKAAWRESGEHSFHVAGDPSEGSILDVDSDDVTEVVTLPTISVADLRKGASIDQIDFLKIEAEGAEPEVLEGIGDQDIPKIAVECAPERDGRPPTEEVTKWLRQREYTVQKRGNIVFGRQ